MEAAPQLGKGKTLSLFTGIGGLDLGVQDALGAEPGFFCEIDPFCSQVLTERFPGIPVIPDVREIGLGLAEITVVHGGYPCQPFSTAGKRLGEQDPRHLWPEFKRIIRVLRPNVVILENVAGHLRLGFDRVLADLAGMGMHARWGVVRACDVGAPHGRARVFCIATDSSGSDGGETKLQSLVADGGRAAEPGERLGPYWGRFRQSVERWELIRGEAAPQAVNAEREVQPEFLEWMMGFPLGWTEGLERLDRLRLLGNSVVPQQASFALRSLL